jgi:hypothetical protein
MTRKKRPTQRVRARSANAPRTVRLVRPDATEPAQLVRSEGQRLLRLVPGSLSEIAAAVRCQSKQSVLDWRNGRQVPGSRMRGALWAAYGIPAPSWDRMHGSSSPTVPSPPIRASGVAPSTLQDCLALLEVIRTARNQADLLPAERVKLADTEARILALRHRLEKEASMLEDAIVREHPAWQRLRRVLGKVLAAHPAAAKAVGDALLEMGM